MQLTIEGVIGAWGDIGSKAVRSFLADASGDIDVYINSVGGDVFDGLSIYNQLKRYEGKVHVIVDGLAASAASVVAMAGDTITMSTGSQLMIHSPWTVTVGDQADHDKASVSLGTANGSILDVYSTRIDDREQLAEWVAAETWFDADAAIEAGFADRIEGKEEAQIPDDIRSQVAKTAWRAAVARMKAEIERKR